MTIDEHTRMFQGEWVVDERTEKLHKRLVKYYLDTPDTVDNLTASKRWREFKQWAVGYTNEEINRAKIAALREAEDIATDE